MRSVSSQYTEIQYYQRSSGFPGVYSDYHHSSGRSSAALAKLTSGTKAEDNQVDEFRVVYCPKQSKVCE